MPCYAIHIGKFVVEQHGNACIYCFPIHIPFDASTHIGCAKHNVKIYNTHNQPKPATRQGTCKDRTRNREQQIYITSLFFAVCSDSFPFPTFCHEMRAHKRSRISCINQNKNRIHHNHIGKRCGRKKKPYDWVDCGSERINAALSVCVFPIWLIEPALLWLLPECYTIFHVLRSHLALPTTERHCCRLIRSSIHHEHKHRPDQTVVYKRTKHINTHRLET